MVTFELPTSLESRLNLLAKVTGRDPSFFIEEALEKSIDDLEDFYLSQAILDHIQAGKEKTYTLKEVEKKLNFEH